MDFYSMTDKAVGAELGARIKALRLRRNLTQQQVAEAAAVSLNVIKALEAGRGKLSSLVAVLRELEALDGLDQFIPAAQVSPLQLAKQQGRKRQRATGTRGDKEPGETSEW
ncbi:MAG: helix-turn-helix transcriptional regulator [Desulfurivibrionaceae bacterium]|nr:helix-turn-helix transcriptional regulator [Desulfurivibrionaceae bacterium]